MFSHGTTCTNIAGGDTYGCATQANMWVYAPKEGRSYWSVIAAFDRIAELRLDATTYGVMSLSWNAPRWRDSALSDALQAVIKTKVIVVASAGNNGVSRRLNIDLSAVKLTRSIGLHGRPHLPTLALDRRKCYCCWSDRHAKQAVRNFELWSK